MNIFLLTYLSLSSGLEAVLVAHRWDTELDISMLKKYDKNPSLLQTQKIYTIMGWEVMIRSSHKLTRILFIILNSKLRIWLCSQPRIDLNSQSNFYDVITRPYTYLVQHTIQQKHALKTIYMLVSPGYETFTLLSSKFISLYILHWQYPIVTTTVDQHFEFL